MSKDMHRLEELLSAYWDAAYQQGIERINHDDEAGSAQKADAELRKFIAGLTDSLKRVQAIAKSTLDKLPERWNMGFQAGLK